MNFIERHEFYMDNEFVLATISKRFAAFLIDWLALFLLYCMIIMMFSLLNIKISSINVIGIFDVEIESNISHVFLTGLLKVFFGLLPVIYFSMSFYMGRGQTIGKYLLKIRVVSLYHKDLGFWHCLERSLGYFASALEFGFGFIQAFWNPNRMSLHDKIGETIVIELKKQDRRNQALD